MIDNIKMLRNYYFKAPLKMNLDKSRGNNMYKICYITSVSSTLNAFVKDVAIYIGKNTDVEITFISSDNEQFKKSLPDNIKFIPVKIDRGFKLGGIKATYKLYKLFRKNKFDLVQYSTPNASFYASVASFFAGIKIRLYAQWGILYTGSHGLKRKLLKTLEKVTCKLSTNIHPDSFGNLNFSVKEKLYSTSKAEVIGNGSASGVNLDVFDVNSKLRWRDEIRKKHEMNNNQFVFGFVGRLVKDKGIIELLKSFKEVSTSNKNLVLMIVGGQQEELKKMDDDIVNWAVDRENIIFCGFTSNVNKYYSAMDVFILPSYREGFGSVVIEAQAMKVPVIVSDIPGPNEIVLDKVNGLITTKANVNDLTKAMNYVILNEEETKKMAENGYQSVVAKYDQKKLFTQILDNRLKLLNRGTLND